MSHKVFAIVSLYDQPELLAHFLSHYAKLGAHRILVVVRTSERDRFFVQAEGDAGQFPASVHWFPADKFADPVFNAGDKSEGDTRRRDRDRCWKGACPSVGRSYCATCAPPRLGTVFLAG